MLTVFGLQFIAMVTMFCDHFGFTFMHDDVIMRCIGRFAFIIYALWYLTHIAIAGLIASYKGELGTVSPCFKNIYKIFYPAGASLYFRRDSSADVIGFET